MKNKVFKYLSIIFLLIICCLLINHLDIIKADSGWDTSYDSGGSWDSGSDWGSDYDYDYDYDNDHDYYYSGSGSSISNNSEPKEMHVGLLFLLVLIFLLIVFEIIINSGSKMVLTNIRSQRKNSVDLKKYKCLTELEANKIISNFNIEEFNFKAYQIFYDIQMSWMNFDYEKLKELVTDELYNSYVMQLDALKIKNHKNTMKEFELIESHIYELKEENGLYIAKVYLNVKFYDYVENPKTGVILRGTPYRKINNIYSLTFICSKQKTDNISTCPQCGANVKGNVTGTCIYCNAKLVNKDYDWVMSKKEKIN